MSSLPNADKLSFDASRYSYNNIRKLLPDLSEKGIDLINRLLTYDPAVRISAREAIEHPYFREKPFPQESSMMPTFPSLHPGMKGSKSRDAHENQQRNRDSMRFGNAFGGQAPPAGAAVASALKKRRV